LNALGRRALRTRLASAARVALAVALLSGSRAALADVGPADIEEAADVARRAAVDLLRSPNARLFSEALDDDGILLRRLGADAWSRLTDRQKDRLRAAVRDRFRRTLKPPPAPGGAAAPAEIVWSTARGTGNAVDVFFGFRFDARTLKTRWSLRHVGGGWRIADIVLVDPGVSIARAAEQSVGPRAVPRGSESQEMWATIAPRAGAIAVLFAIALLVRLRVPRARRPLVYWTAFAPAALIAVDGGLAVHRMLTEPFVVAPTGTDRWRTFEQLALAAEREGKLDAAREMWGRALGAGGPAGPIEYQIGLAALRRGDTVHAEAEFARSLAERDFAPGAARELGAIQVAGRHFAEAEPLLMRYLELAGPDPDTLSLLAVVQTNTGKNAEALQTIREARALVVGEAWRGEELEAQVHARAGDAPGTVAALRTLDAQGLVDRAALRADPSYLAIANDPAWIAFLNEKRKKSP